MTPIYIVCIFLLNFTSLIFSSLFLYGCSVAIIKRIMARTPVTILQPNFLVMSLVSFSMHAILSVNALTTLIGNTVVTGSFLTDISWIEEDSPKILNDQYCVVTGVILNFLCNCLFTFCMTLGVIIYLSLAGRSFSNSFLQRFKANPMLLSVFGTAAIVTGINWVGYLQSINTPGALPAIGRFGISCDFLPKRNPLYYFELAFIIITSIVCVTLGVNIMILLKRSIKRESHISKMSNVTQPLSTKLGTVTPSESSTRVKGNVAYRCYDYTISTCAITIWMLLDLLISKFMINSPISRYDPVFDVFSGMAGINVCLSWGSVDDISQEIPFLFDILKVINEKMNLKYEKFKVSQESTTY